MNLRRTALGITLALGVFWSQAAMAGTLQDGISAFERRDFGRATELLERYAREFPKDPRPYYYLAKCYETRFQVSKVEDALRNYRQLTTERTQVFRSLVGAESDSVYDRMLKEDPRDLSAKLLLAIALLEMKSYGLAEEIVAAIPPASIPEEIRDAYYNIRGAIYTSRKEWDQAKEAYNQAWRLNYSNPLPRQKLQEVDKLAAQAQAEFDKAPIFAPVSAEQKYEMTLKLGKDLMAEGNFNGAIDAFAQAVELQPNSADARRLLSEVKRRAAEHNYDQGITFMRDRKFTNAYEAFHQALQNDPNFTKAQIGLTEAKRLMDEEARSNRL
ncbi:lipoprotein NlpI [compost metagenome]